MLSRGRTWIFIGCWRTDGEDGVLCLLERYLAEGQKWVLGDVICLCTGGPTQSPVTTEDTEAQMPGRGTQSHTPFLEWQGMLSRPGFFPSRIEPCKDAKILCFVSKTNRRMEIVSLTSTRIEGGKDGALRPDKSGSYPSCATC